MQQTKYLPSLFFNRVSSDVQVTLPIKRSVLKEILQSNSPMGATFSYQMSIRDSATYSSNKDYWTKKEGYHCELVEDIIIAITVDPADSDDGVTEDTLELRVNGYFRGNKIMTFNLKGHFKKRSGESSTPLEIYSDNNPNWKEHLKVCDVVEVEGFGFGSLSSFDSIQVTIGAILKYYDSTMI